MTQSDTFNTAESTYIAKINKIFSFALLIHIGIALGFSAYFETGMTFAFLASLAICSLPLGLRYFTAQHKLTAFAHAVSMMFFSGLLIHLSRGMIETHFHIFVSIAALILYANPFVVLAATVTIAVHHVGFYFLLPESVFNYQASLGIVIIHAVYVVVETIPCMFIAKKFGDYIIRQGVVVGQINEMYKTMNKMILDLKNANEAVAQDNQVQTDSVTKTAEAINQIEHMLNSTTSNAEESKLISQKTKLAASGGLEAMRELSVAFAQMKDSNGDLFRQMEVFNSQLSEIVSSIKQIEDKTQIINDIVFQTKLLSFNASVEAARAGEHGKGFAVVAEEVGNLAAMSGNASKEINQLINDSVQRVVTISESTQGKIKEISSISKRCFEEGDKKTHATSSRFNELMNTLEALNTKVIEIHNASAEQAIGIKSITSAVRELETVNHRSVKSQMVSKEVSGNLSNLSNHLGELVKDLDLSEDKAA